MDGRWYGSVGFHRMYPYTPPFPYSLLSLSPNSIFKAVGLGILHLSSDEYGSDGLGGNLID